MATLTAKRLLAESGEPSFERGVDYVRYVAGLRVTGSRTVASVRGSRAYLVELDWSGKDYLVCCTCPHFGQGFFCKHLVAVGLATIDHLGLDSDVRRKVEQPAALDHASVSSDELEAMARDGLAVRGEIDYRRSFELAREAHEVLDHLEAALDAGATDVASSALRVATNRLSKLGYRADDSSGSIGDASQRALELYARACREGSPHGRKLARWLVRFRVDSPGWPQATLADFADAFDEAAMATYRREVAKLDTTQGGHRFEARQMQLELADQDGDVDGAIELLVEGDHPSYGEVVQRLRNAGRDAEVVGWLDRAVTGGRVNSLAGGILGLDPVDIAATYREVGRVDDGLAVLRAEFERDAGAATLRSLLEYAAVDGRQADERSWALARAAELARSPYPAGAALVEIALVESDLAAAWESAKTYGPGHHWRRLAEAIADFAPLDAAGLYRVEVDKQLTMADTGRYPAIAEQLVTMRRLHARAGAVESFDRYLVELRDSYQRRPALMRALALAGL